MTYFNANSIAVALNITPASFSNWMKNHINELTDSHKYIKKDGKFVYYHPIIVKEIFEKRNTPIPEKIMKAIEDETYRLYSERIKSFYQIEDMDDAIKLLVKFQKENQKLKKQVIDLEHQVDLLFVKLDTKEADYDRLEKMHKKAIDALFYFNDNTKLEDDIEDDEPEQELSFYDYFGDNVSDLDNKDTEPK